MSKEKMELKLAKDFRLPLDVMTQVEVVLAKRRAGKSYTMRRIVEQLLHLQQQVVLVDPKGDQWGLRSSADGKKPGYPVLILGGEHGDLPLEASGGEVVARLVVEERVSCLLDLSQFRKHEVATFMTAFLENLYRLKAQEKYRTPMKLVIDEADAIAPQRPQKGEERMLGAIEDIVRRGGQRGIGCTLVSQRSAVLNKNVLTQAQVLIVLRTIAPQDIMAMKAWIDVHGTPEQGRELIDSLPSLPVGDAWFWSPGWPTDEGIFKRVHVLPIETFDSGATPKPGQKVVIPKTYAEVDLDALKGQMAATIEKKKADDPKLLRAEIARLTKLIDKPVKTVVAQDAKAIDRAVRARDAQWRRVVKEWSECAYTLGVALEKAQKILEAVPDMEWPDKEPKDTEDTPQQTTVFIPQNERRHTLSVENFETSKPLSKGARTVLTYLHSVYPHWKSKTQLWVAAGYAPGGGFNNIIYELTGAGLIEKSGSKYAAITPVPQELLEHDFDPSLDKWNAKLSLGARKVFHFLLGQSELQTKEQLAQATGYALGGGFNNCIYELTGKELAIKDGTGYKINPEILEL